MRILSTILLGSLAMVAFATEKQELTRYTLEGLDPAVKAEVERALQEADRARVAYLQAIQKANEAAVQRIDRQVATQTRRGNLEGALAARQMVERLNEGWLKEQAEAEFDLVGNRVVNVKEEKKNAIVGVWEHGGATRMVFQENNRFHMLNRPTHGGTWEIMDDENIRLTWESKPLVEIVIHSNGTYTFVGRSFIKVE
jgi:hypothetical protein